MIHIDSKLNYLTLDLLVNILIRDKMIETINILMERQVAKIYTVASHVYALYW